MVTQGNSTAPKYPAMQYNGVLLFLARPESMSPHLSQRSSMPLQISGVSRTTLSLQNKTLWWGLWISLFTDSIINILYSKIKREKCLFGTRGNKINPPCPNPPGNSPMGWAEWSRQPCILPQLLFVLTFLQQEQPDSVFSQRPDFYLPNHGLGPIHGSIYWSRKHLYCSSN